MLGSNLTCLSLISFNIILRLQVLVLSVYLACFTGTIAACMSDRINIFYSLGIFSTTSFIIQTSPSYTIDNFPNLTLCYFFSSVTCQPTFTILSSLIVRNWFSSICFLWTCFIYSNFGGFYWVISRHGFWTVLAATLFRHVRIRKDYIGISLVVFPCSFLVIFPYYYLSYSYIILS